MNENTCLGCKYDSACGDPTKIEPCAGKIPRSAFIGGLPIKKLTDTAIIPTRGTEDAAGLDFYVDSVELRDLEDPFDNGYYTPTVECDSIMLEPYQKFKVHTGIACAIPKGCVGLLFNRSGIAVKQDLRLANCVGVIDADYRGEIVGVFQSDCPECQTIDLKSRAVQLVIVPYLPLNPILVNELDSTDRGAGGFGSTGTT